MENSSAPPRNKVVGVADWLLVSLVIVLVTAAVPFGAHLAYVADSLDHATVETNRQPPLVALETHVVRGRIIRDQVVVNRRPTGLHLIAFYARDVLVLLAILVLVTLLIGTLRRLWRGSSGARNVAVILAGVVALGSLVIGGVWGGISTVDLPAASFDAAYARFEQASTQGWTGPLVRTATIALPLIALCTAILLLSRPATGYFRAMRRSGTY